MTHHDTNPTPTGKPDPLESLQLWAEKNILDPNHPVCLAGVAWEKDRARLDREVKQNQGMASMLLALRAAVEKVRDELRVLAGRFDPQDSRGTKAIRLANALDAALQGDNP